MHVLATSAYNFFFFLSLELSPSHLGKDFTDSLECVSISTFVTKIIVKKSVT